MLFLDVSRAMQTDSEAMSSTRNASTVTATSKSASPRSGDIIGINQNVKPATQNTKAETTSSLPRKIGWRRSITMRPAMSWLESIRPWIVENVTPPTEHTIKPSNRRKPNRILALRRLVMSAIRATMSMRSQKRSGSRVPSAIAPKSLTGRRCQSPCDLITMKLATN